MGKGGFRRPTGSDRKRNYRNMRRHNSRRKGDYVVETSKMNPNRRVQTRNKETKNGLTFEKRDKKRKKKIYNGTCLKE